MRLYAIAQLDKLILLRKGMRPVTTLIFQHEGWEVVTTSWSAAAKPGKGVVVCYEWGPDRVGWLDNSVSTARVTLNMHMAEFIHAIHDKQIVDLRSRQVERQR